jgi:hypothetical protein
MTQPTDIRDALERLLKAVDGHVWDATERQDAIAAARAALAQPEGEGPGEQEIDAFIYQWWEAFGKGYLPNSSDKSLVAAALARWGCPTAPPAPEVREVGDLIRCLQIRAASLGAEGANLSQRGDAFYFDRAATLLLQLSAPAPAVVPVAVSERPYKRL